MKPKAPPVVALVVLLATLLSAAVATAQDSAQDVEPGDLSSQTDSTSNSDPGSKQITIFEPGQTTTNSSGQDPAWSVYIRDDYFDLADVAVEPGSTITWINKGNEPHTVTADDGLFDSGVLYPGDSYTVWFGGAGTVPYHCEIHPGMKGSVVVGSV